MTNKGLLFSASAIIGSFISCTQPLAKPILKKAICNHNEIIDFGYISSFTQRYGAQSYTSNLDILNTTTYEFNDDWGQISLVAFGCLIHPQKLLVLWHYKDNSLLHEFSIYTSQRENQTIIDWSKLNPPNGQEESNYIFWTLDRIKRHITYIYQRDNHNQSSSRHDLP